MKPFVRIRAAVLGALVMLEQPSCAVGPGGDVLDPTAQLGDLVGVEHTGHDEEPVAFPRREIECGDDR